MEKGENDKGDEECLIPAIVRNEKDSNWFSELDSYVYIFGRKCCSNGILNGKTMPSVQYEIGKALGVKCLTCFRRGAFILSGKYQILIEESQSQPEICVLGGMPKNSSEANTVNKLECEELFCKVFDIVFAKVAKTNPLRSLTKMMVSIDGKLKGEDVVYDLEDVVKHYASGCDVICDSNLGREHSVQDTVNSLLMDKEKKVLVIFWSFRLTYLWESPI